MGWNVDCAFVPRFFRNGVFLCEEVVLQILRKDGRLVCLVIVPTVRPDGRQFEPSPAVIVCGNAVFLLRGRFVALRRGGFRQGGAELPKAVP